MSLLLGLSALAILACGGPPCPDMAERFVPTEDPEDDRETRDTGEEVRCGDEWLRVVDIVETHYYLYCECGLCADAYVGNEYCVPKTALSSWTARSCPACRISTIDHRTGGPWAAEVRCSALGCADAED